MRKPRRALFAVTALTLVAASSAAAFTPTNSYYRKQWYLGQDHAFDAWAVPPALQPVRVAIVDSGVDCSLPDFQGQIAATRSFVGGSGCSDTAGHGTIVAGEIAGRLRRDGVVGLDWAAQLLVAKVVAADGTIRVKAEAAGIRWAVNQGARVINLSFGAVRDPLDPRLDGYSRLEAKAVAYAVAKGAVVVAAVGNSDQAPVTPWPYASWPAALPHVIGVAALTRAGNVPDFSDRDLRFVDLAAPGVDIFSTFPKALTEGRPDCTPQGYTQCAPSNYMHPQGTSFAAAQVSAAAAVLLGIDPLLTNSQVAAILERTADDVDAATGCAACPVGHDMYSGWGRLDVANAVAAVSSGQIPPPDCCEPNNDISQAWPLWGETRTLKATVDYYEDPVDLYRVKLKNRQKLKATAVATEPGTSVGLLLWPPGTRTVIRPRGLAAESVRHGAAQHFVFRARTAGWYYVEVRATAPQVDAFSLTPYSLSLVKLRLRAFRT